MKLFFCILAFGSSVLSVISAPIRRREVMAPVNGKDQTNCIKISGRTDHDNTTLLPALPCNNTEDNIKEGNSTFMKLPLDETLAEITTELQLINSSSLSTITNVKTENGSSQTPISGRNLRLNNFPADCGRSSVTFQRIIGGQESTLGSWPWMAVVFLMRRGKKSPECGGTLVTDSHVITAAHCVVTSRRGNTLNPRLLVVRLGELDVNSDSDGAHPIDVSVKSIIRHENFNIRNFQNDIAILVLSSHVTFNQNIAPICLPFNHFTQDTLEERNAFTAGWGTLSYGGSPSSRLMEVQLRIWQNRECQNIFRNDVPITQVNLCAGDGDKDACSGDSGGPLMLTDEDGKYYLIGIVSFGKKCAEPGIPGVYVRVSTFLDWIEQKIE